MTKFVWCFIFLLVPVASYAEELPQSLPKFTGKNFSGDYECKGKNESVGDYEVFVSLKLNLMNSHNNFAVYDFNTETTNKVIYFGQAIANGTRLAMTFKLSNSKNVEFSTGIGEFKSAGKNRWSFSNTYYEPDDTGGNFGSEQCIMKTPAPKIEQTPKKTQTPKSEGK